MNKQLTISLLIFTLSLLIRTYKINSPDFVLWDEAHFGKFSLQYLKRKFYFDVHPPLGRLLTTFFGYLSDQPLDFAFESATKYPKEFNYIFMRCLHAAVSSFVPLFCELTLKELNYTKPIRYLITTFLIFENGFISISRLILLDSHLMTFTSATIYFLCKYLNCKSILNMCLLGISIGCVMSIKWIGCFTTLFVGMFIAWELTEMFCDSKIPLKEVLKQFIYRVVALILVPISIYLLFFVVHFRILENHSADVVYVNSIFGLTLKKPEETLTSDVSKQTINENKEILKYVDFGHPISLKSGLDYLHSHEHTYPNIAINQVTGYRHIDSNNDWAFQKVTDESDTEEFLQSKVDVALLHIKTKRYLGVSPPILDSENRRADCRNKKLLEENIFQLEFVDDWNKKESLVKSISTSFLIKFKTDKYYYLKMTDKKYPNWGFNQLQVVFTNKKSEASVWTVDNNFKKSTSSLNNPVYTDLLKSKLLFFKFFKDLNFSMYKINKSFVQEEDEEQARIVSKPYEWPILIRGLRMGTWDKENEKFYMFINPLLWLLSSLSVCLAPFIFLSKALKYKRKGKDLKELKGEFIGVLIVFGGWFFHYFPFFYVSRVCYFHHYFPSLYFASLSIAYILKELSTFWLMSLSGFYILVFIAYAPLTYGFRNINSLRHLQLIKSWDFI